MSLAELKAEKIGFVMKAFQGNGLGLFSRQIVPKLIRKFFKFLTRMPNFERFFYEISDIRKYQNKLCWSVKFIFIVKMTA